MKTLLIQKTETGITAKTETIETLADTDVLVELMGAVINPADINMIEDNYLIKPTFPYCFVALFIAACFIIILAPKPPT